MTFIAVHVKQRGMKMSKWDELWNPETEMDNTVWIWMNTLLSEKSHLVDWIKAVKVEGDKMQSEFHELQTLNQRQFQETGRLEKELRSLHRSAKMRENKCGSP